MVFLPYVFLLLHQLCGRCSIAVAVNIIASINAVTIYHPLSSTQLSVIAADGCIGIVACRLSNALSTMHLSFKDERYAKSLDLY
jgi:hypothetical protein